MSVKLAVISGLRLRWKNHLDRKKERLSDSIPLDTLETTSSRSEQCR